MSRLVSKGPTYEYQTMCKSCGYRVAFQQKDVKSYTSSSYDGSSDTETYIECPNTDCKNKRIYVNTYKMEQFPVDAPMFNASETQGQNTILAGLKSLELQIAQLTQALLQGNRAGPDVN